MGVYMSATCPVMDKPPSAPTSLTVIGLGPRLTKVASGGLSITYCSSISILRAHLEPTVEYFSQTVAQGSFRLV